MAATIVAAAIAAGVGIYGMIKSNKEKKKAQENFNKVKEPKYQIPQREYDVTRMLESMADNGLSSRTRELAMQGYDRGLNRAISAIQLYGGSSSDVNKAYRAYTDNVDRLAILDEQQRDKNYNRLLAQYQRMTDLETAQWQINEYAPAVNARQFYAAQYQLADRDNKQAMNLTAQGVMTAAGAVDRFSSTNKAQGGSGFLNMNKNPSDTSSATMSGSGIGVISAKTGGYINQIDWGRIRPENQSSIYQLLNSPYYNYSQTG